MKVNLNTKIRKLYKSCCQAVVDDCEWNVGCNGVNSSEGITVMAEVYRMVIGEEPPDPYDICEETDWESDDVLSNVRK